MPILIKNRSQYAEDVVNKISSDLECLQAEVIGQIKHIMTQLISIESLYEIRDYIDDLIVNWEDEEIEIEEDDL